MSSLTVESELRYVVQWFSEWSEFQREDFLPIMVEYLNKSSGITLNGVVIGAGSCTEDKPMSLFQCRAKLFREWTPKWPDTLKESLLEQIAGIDEEFSKKIRDELTVERPSNGLPAAVGGIQEIVTEELVSLA